MTSTETFNASEFPEGEDIPVSEMSVEERLEAMRQSIEHLTQNKIRGLNIRMEGDVLVMEGKSSTYYAKQIVTHAAINYEFRDVRNDITVGN